MRICFTVGLRGNGALFWRSRLHQRMLAALALSRFKRRHSRHLARLASSALTGDIVLEVFIPVDTGHSRPPGLVEEGGAQLASRGGDRVDRPEALDVGGANEADGVSG